MTATFTYQYKRAYQVASKWRTIVDEIHTGGEQRRNVWTQSRKSWVLEFDKNSTDTAAILAFFDARKGRFEAFYWTWQATHPDDERNMGGDGSTYLVRFDEDELSMDHRIGGYKNFQIKITEVAS